MKSAVNIVPAQLRDSYNVLAAALGWGSGNCSVPLYTGDTITHYGGRANVSPTFEEIIGNALQGILPDELIAQGADPQQVQALLQQATIDIAPRTEGEGEDAVTIQHSSPRAHFEAVVDSLGLTWIQEQME
jgi:hypothetical protein